MIAVVVGDVNSDAAEVGVEVVAAAVVAAGVDVGEDVAVEVGVSCGGLSLITLGYEDNRCVGPSLVWSTRHVHETGTIVGE